jgi:hypothetical protein
MIAQMTRAVLFAIATVANLGPLQRAFQWKRLGVVSPQLECSFPLLVLVFDNSDYRKNHIT